jgi:hypothetical protein
MEYVHGYGHGEVLTANLVNGLHNILSAGGCHLYDLTNSELHVIDALTRTNTRCVDISAPH